MANLKKLILFSFFRQCAININIFLVASADGDVIFYVSEMKNEKVAAVAE